MPPIYVRIVGRRGMFKLPRIQEVNPVTWGFGTSLAIWFMSNGPKSSNAPLTIPEIQRRFDFAARNRAIGEVGFPAIHQRMREQAVQVYRQLPFYKEYASSFVYELLAPFLSFWSRPR
ncbi:hypothetical protein PG997_011373 [Apiospora hydei]|uniref:Uncharacterized protein n=1 Tax=Apiospora hydei TaxID=1337664 RepID=A0ABR1VIV8_9PEZI